MSLQLPNVPPTYDASNESRARQQLALADNQNLKRGSDIVGSRLILRSPDGHTWLIAVDNAGALSAVAVTL